MNSLKRHLLALLAVILMGFAAHARTLPEPTTGVVWKCVTYLHVPGGDYQVCSTVTYFTWDGPAETE